MAILSIFQVLILGTIAWAVAWWLFKKILAIAFSIIGAILSAIFWPIKCVFVALFGWLI